MSGINKAIIVGRLGQDPEVRYSAGGTAVCNLSVATSEKYKGEEQTEWHRIVLFGKTAEVAHQYLRKGSLAGFEGKIQTRKWQDQQGNDRYSTEILCHKMDMLSKAEGGQQSGHNPPPGNKAGDDSQQQAPLDDGFDDIPF